MLYDGHIHLISSEKGSKDDFYQNLKKADIAGGIVFSQPPASFIYMGKPLPPEKRLKNLFYWTDIELDLYPFYWIDPLEEDAKEQVRLAVDHNIKGFKVICNNFYPGDDRPMEVFKLIAELRKPLFFHSGILYDGTFSSIYNRPAGFEALLEIENLKFTLAHVSWPWCDELIAVYGKYQNARRRRSKTPAELFIDLTPGTPPIYREEVLTKLYAVGYDVEDNIFFGTDNRVTEYRPEYAREWISRDRDIYRQINLSDKQIDKIFAGNIKRFLNIEAD